MINKLNYGKVNGDSEELHALKGFKVLAVGKGTIGEECALRIMLMNENRRRSVSQRFLRTDRGHDSTYLRGLER